GDVFERVRADYVKKPNDGKLIESAINGMLAGLDPHSGYMDSKSFRDMQVQTRGEFGGLQLDHSAGADQSCCGRSETSHAARARTSRTRRAPSPACRCSP